LNGLIDRLVNTIMEMGGSPAIQNKLKDLETEKAQIIRALAISEDGRWT